MKLAIEAEAASRKEFLKDTTPIPEKYKLVDFAASPIKERLEPLCRLFVSDPGHLNGKLVNFVPSFQCSCSFVGPTTVMTAAHCFFNKAELDGKKMEIVVEERMLDPKAAWVVYVVRQYGMKGANEEAHLTHTTENAQLALEWWTPTRYKIAYEVKEGIKTWEADIAFVKVGKAVQPDQQYTFTAAWTEKCDFYAGTVVQLGYPADYRGGEVAVWIEGKLKEFDDKWVDHMSRGETALKTNLQKGDMFRGGSGGPWIRGTETTKFKLNKKQCSMHVFGLTTQALPTEVFSGSTSPLITDELPKALAVIQALPDSLSKASPAKGATVAEEKGASIQVVHLELS